MRRPQSTKFAIDVIHALDGDMPGRRLDRFLRHPEGRRLYFARPSLLSLLEDEERLAALPDGSVGRAYLEYLEKNGLRADGLVQLRRRFDPVRERGEGEAWFTDRSELMHDLWHVLTGYGTDRAGEAAILTFTQAQIGGRSHALLGLGIGFQMGRVLQRRDWPGYLLRCWTRGRRAACLDLLPYEELLPLPLAAVREAVGVGDPDRVHPGGVIASQHRKDEIKSQRIPA